MVIADCDMTRVANLERSLQLSQLSVHLSLNIQLQHVKWQNAAKYCSTRWGRMDRPFAIASHGSAQGLARFGSAISCSRNPRRAGHPATATLAETVPPTRSDTAGPISAELAKRCRALAFKTHPTERAGTTPYAKGSGTI